MLTPKEAWQATLGQLQLQLNRATFDTWLKGAELLAYEDGEFIVRVRHAYAKDWLEKHLTRQINQTLSDIFQRTAQVNFVVYLANRQQEGPDSGPLFSANKSQAAAPTSTPLADRFAQWAGEQPQDRTPDYSEWDPRINPIRFNDPPSARLDDASPLDHRCTFDNFVTGPSNHFAWAAAQAAADAPGTRYNPLVFYGDSGLGKTHLLNSIGHVCRANGQHVLYTTAEAFTNELLMAIRAHKTDELRERYRHVDVLLMDDVQFMAGKASTEEEFYHTFNALVSRGGQIVIACNQHPRTLDKLDDRLRSRLQGGLLADLQPPEFETRREILHVKALAQGTRLPEAIAEVLAQHPVSSVRELEGLLTQVLARATLTGQPLTVELAGQVLHKNGGQSVASSPAPMRRQRAAKLEEVLEATATYHQLSLDDMLGKRRTKDVVRARQVAMYLAREETEASLPEIGEAFGGRAHTTIMHGYEKIAQSVEADIDLQREVVAIRQQLYLFSED
jgi:chromosomal replication initiator protein